MNPDNMMTLAMVMLILACGVTGYAMGRNHQHHIEQRIKWQSQMRKSTSV